MSIRDDLEKITVSLDNIQRHCEDILKAEISETDDTEKKLQLSDVYKIIDSDISCRLDLYSISEIIPRVSFSDESYDTFIEYSKIIIDNLKGYPLPDDIEKAYKVSEKAVTDNMRCTLQEVFTIISVQITAVALCITKIDKDELSKIIEMLDTLLEIKERQLILITQMSKWRSEYIS